MSTACLTLICCILRAVLEDPRYSSMNNPRLSYALESIVVSFSDQQVITGIAILISGFSQLNKGISVYHWQTIVNLSWFSTVTHMLTLTVLRDQLKKNSLIRALRIIGMGLLVVMLCVALWTLGWVDDKMPLNFPAWCLYHKGVSWAFVDGDDIGDNIGDGFNWLYLLVQTLDLLVSKTKADDIYRSIN
jgi:hypothetical protein